MRHFSVGKASGSLCADNLLVSSKSLHYSLADVSTEKRRERFDMKILIGLLVMILGSMGCDAPVHKIEKISEDAIVIDVRTPQEFQSGHIKNAINIPYDVIGFKMKDVTEEKDREVLLYCRSGRRSGIALETLNKLGYTHAKNMGGYEAFKKQLGQ
jgi:phage shock protein E